MYTVTCDQNANEKTDTTRARVRERERERERAHYLDQEPFHSQSNHAGAGALQAMKQ